MTDIIPTKPKVLILTGLPASGKSTYAREWVERGSPHRVRINYDELRAGRPFSWETEKEVKATALANARAALVAGRSLAIDNTNLSDKARAPWLGLAREFAVDGEVFEMPTPLDECVKRDRLREGQARVGRAVIERMALTHGMIDWGEVPGRFVICDIDGTVADLSYRRHFVERHAASTCQGEPFEWVEEDGKRLICSNCGAPEVKKDWASFLRPSNVALDKPIKPIFDLIRLLSLSYNILMVSGRGTELGKVTEDWLDTNWPNVGSLPTYRHLFMRAAADHRPDYIIKGEIADLLPLDRVAYVIDDRDQVVDMWRGRGLTVLQCADGDF